MKIALYAETFPPDGSGGVATAHWQLGQLLQGSHQVRYFAFADARENQHSEIVRAARTGLQGRILAWALTRFIRRRDRTGLLAYCPRIARTVPAIRRLNGALARFRPDVVIVSDHNLPALALRKPAGVPVVWVAHHNYTRFRNQPLIDGPCDYDCFLAHRLERRAVRKADYAVFTSHYMERVFRASLGAAPSGRVIPNGFTPPEGSLSRRAQIRAELSVHPEAVLVYVPSGGTAIKGGRYVPALMQRLARARAAVAFYVSGPLSETFRWEVAQMLPGAQLIVPGRLEYERHLHYVAACDLAVSPALLENYSCALLEAQALGVPCVTFDVGGNREVVADGITGFIVPYLDLDGLDRQAALLVTDPALRRRMSTAAQAHGARVADPEQLRSAWTETLLAASAGLSQSPC